MYLAEHILLLLHNTINNMMDSRRGMQYACVRSVVYDDIMCLAEHVSVKLLAIRLIVAAVRS